jgi:Restriction endonuclease
MPEIDMRSALEQFERAELNAARLAKLWDAYRANMPDDIAFGLDSIESDNVRREWARLVQALPAIDGFRPDSDLMSYDAIASCRLDYREIGEFEATISFERAVESPGRELADYQYRLKNERRRLTHHALNEAIHEVDDLLAQTQEIDRGRAFPGSSENGWETLNRCWEQIHGLLATDMPSNGRWSDMARHLHFAEPHDLRDIYNMDWPSIRQSILDHVFQGEPLRVEVEDLAVYRTSSPTGTVSTSLNWAVLDDDAFERVVLGIVESLEGYENARRLMKTRAADKGRDLSADRIIRDGLGGTRRVPIMIQCKHYQSRSVDIDECIKSVEQAKLWTEANFRVVIVATSGHFTQQAVEWLEKRAADGLLPAVEFLAQSDLERLLASKPAIRTAFGL